MNGSQRIINVIRQAIEQETASGARLHYTPGVVYESGGAYTASAYVRVDDLVDEIVLPAGAYLNSGDYIIVGMTSDGQRSWVERILPKTLYSKMVFDFGTGRIGLGDGESGEYDWVVPGEGDPVNLDDSVIRSISWGDQKEAVDNVPSDTYADAGHQHSVDLDHDHSSAYHGTSLIPESVHNVYYFPSSGGDDAAALQALIDSVDPGSTIFLVDDAYTLGSEVQVDKSNIAIIGRGIGQSIHNGTYITRTGSTGAGILWSPPTPPPYPDRVTDGGRLSGVTIDSSAQYALNLNSVSNVLVDNCWLVGGSIASAYLSTSPYAGSTSYNDIEGARLRDSFVYASEDGIGVLMLGNSLGGGGRVYGVTLDNVSINHRDGSALEMDVADSLDLINIRVATGGTGNTFVSGDNVNNVRIIGGYQMVAGNMVIHSGPTTYGAFSILGLGLSTVDSTRQPQIDVGAQLRFVYDDGRHNLVPDTRSFMLLRDEFIGGDLSSGNLGELRWSSSGTITAQTAIANHPGVIRMDTSAVSGTNVFIGMPNSGTGRALYPAERFTATWINRPNHVDSDTLIRIGFAVGGQAGNNPPSGGIYFEKLTTDTNWFAVCRSGGTESRDDTGIAAVADWTKFVIRRISTTTIAFYIGNVMNYNATSTLFTNIPTTGLTAFTAIRNNVASSKTIDMDLFQLDIIGLDR